MNRICHWLLGCAVRVEIAKLELRPGDVLVAKMGQVLPTSTRNALAANVSALLPPGTRLLLLDSSVELTVLTKAEIDARAVQS